jgi:hypothetical protein
MHEAAIPVLVDQGLCEASKPGNVHIHDPSLSGSHEAPTGSWNRSSILWYMKIMADATSVETNAVVKAEFERSVVRCMFRGPLERHVRGSACGGHW